MNLHVNKISSRFHDSENQRRAERYFQSAEKKITQNFYSFSRIRFKKKSGQINTEFILIPTKRTWKGHTSDRRKIIPERVRDATLSGQKN